MFSSTTQPSTQLPSPLQVIEPDWRYAQDYRITVKRDDLIHPIISGNKWRKLRHLDENLLPNIKGAVASFGGGYSNHLHALSFCCKQHGLHNIAFIRGNYTGNETPMIKDLLHWGTHIVYLSKVDYSQRDCGEYLTTLSRRYDIEILIPEGGSHTEHLAGLQGLHNEFTEPVDHLILPVASGGTLAGLAVSKGNIRNLLGIAVLKGQDYLESLVTRLVAEHRVNTPYTISHEYCLRGYAKSTPELDRFCIDTENQLGLPVEPVYSGKVLMALKALIENRAFTPGSTIAFLHTGGLQGAR